MPRSMLRVDTSELRRALENADEGLKKRLADANRAAAQVVVDAALPRVPVRSGRLKRSVKALGSQKRGEAKAGGAAVPYAAAIHWGRKKGGFIKARPFLQDAAKASQARVIDVYERAVADIVDELD